MCCLCSCVYRYFPSHCFVLNTRMNAALIPVFILGIGEGRRPCPAQELCPAYAQLKNWWEEKTVGTSDQERPMGETNAVVADRRVQAWQAAVMWGWSTGWVDSWWLLNWFANLWFCSVCAGKLFQSCCNLSFLKANELVCFLRLPQQYFSGAAPAERRCLLQRSCICLSHLTFKGGGLVPQTAMHKLSTLPGNRHVMR